MLVVTCRKQRQNSYSSSMLRRDYHFTHLVLVQYMYCTTFARTIHSYSCCCYYFREGFERHKFELRNLTTELQYNERQLQPKVHTCTVHYTRYKYHIAHYKSHIAGTLYISMYENFRVLNFDRKFFWIHDYV